MRHGAELDLTPVPPTATAVFFGASYHADYATILAAPGGPAGRRGRAGRLPRRAVRPPRRGTSSTCAGCAAAIRRPTRWPRRSAAREMAEGWTLNVEREDVCPVVTLPGRRRHGRPTSRRSARRSATRSGARSGGPRPSARSGFDDSADPLADLDAFIELHQKRWGADGLFPDTPGGAQSRVLVPAAVRAPRRRRPAPADVPVGRRATDRGGHPFRDRRRATSTTTPASTPTPATSRRAC